MTPRTSISFQQTLKSAVTLTGIGLHSGKRAEITLRPARVGHGVVFVRSDLDGSPEIPARFQNVVSTQLSTTLGRGKATISTVEHVMAALYGLKVDNVLIEVNGPEVPILDGSSGPFCEAIREVGVVSQTMARPTLILHRRVEVKVAEKWAVAEPSSRLEVHGSVEWDHPMIGYQDFHYVDGNTPFDEIASARTFCMLRDVEMMKKHGLAQGGSLDNAVVLDEATVLNPGGFRYSNEVVRHKVLDALGDFKLSGFEMRAYIRMHRAGHELHTQLLNAIFSNPDHYEIIDSSLDTEELLPQIRALARGLVASVS